MSKAAVAMTFILFSCTTFSALAMECRKQVEAALIKSGVPTARLVATDKLGMSQGKDYIMWFVTPTCGSTGYLNVTVNNACYVQEVFTRWGCRIPGLRHYSM